MWVKKIDAVVGKLFYKTEGHRRLITVVSKNSRHKKNLLSFSGVRLRVITLSAAVKKTVVGGIGHFAAVFVTVELHLSLAL
jgi:hypothetical protein